MKKKYKKIFKTDKVRKDLIFLYLTYAYLDIGLREENWVTQNKFGVNIINNEQLKMFSNDVKNNIKTLYNTTKRIFKILMQYGVFNQKKPISDIITIGAKTEINKAFSGLKDTSIVPIYLGILMLLKYKEDVKYKTVNFSIGSLDHLADISLDIEEDHPELNDVLDKSIKVIDNFYNNLYRDEPWYVKEEKINLKELFYGKK